MVPAQPVILPVGSSSVCLGDTVTLRLGSGSSGMSMYSWFKGGNPQPAATDTLRVWQQGVSWYAVEVWSAEGCRSKLSDSLEVSIGNPRARVDVAGGGKVCYGGSVRLEGSGTLVGSGRMVEKYLWRRSDGYRDTTYVGGREVQGSGDGRQTQVYTYTLAVRDNEGCQSEETGPVQVTFLRQPQLTAVRLDSVCDGESALLTAQPGGQGRYRWSVYKNYKWQKPRDPGVEATDPIATPDYVLAGVTAADGGRYMVQVTSVDGCEAKLEGQLRVNPLPPAPQLKDVLGGVCYGDSVRLELESADAPRYEWRLRESGGSERALVGSSSVYMAKRSGTYSVRSVSAEGCRSTGADEKAVSVYANPGAPQLTALVKVCAGDRGTLEAQGSATLYRWYHVDTTGGTYTYSPAGGIPGIAGSVYGVESDAAGHYAAMAYAEYTTTEGGRLQCFSGYSNVGEVKRFERPAPPTLEYRRASSLGDGNACDGDVVTLEASGLLANDRYQWRVNGADDRVTTVDSVQVRGVGRGRYSVLVEGGNGCLSPSSVELAVTIHPRPEVKIAGSDTAPWRTSCGEAVQLQAGSAPGAYTWYNGGVPILGETSSHYEVKPNADRTVRVEGRYSVSMVSAEGCASLSQSSAVDVFIRPLPPELRVESPADTCAGVRGVALRASPSGAGGYEWLFERREGGEVKLETVQRASSDTSFQLAALEERHGGRYWVRVENQFGCRSEAYGDVRVNASPARPTVEGSLSRRLCAGDTVEIQAYTFSEGATYRWYVGGELQSGAKGGSYTARVAGVYAVSGVSAQGCESEASVVEVEVRPNPEKPVIAPYSDTIRVCADGQVVVRGISAGAKAWQWYTVNAMGYYEQILKDGDSSHLLVNSSGRYAVSAQVEHVGAGWTLLCSSMSDPKVLELNPMLQAPIIRMAEDASGGEVSSGCDGDELVLKATMGAGSPPVSRYRWFKDGVEQVAVTDSVYLATKVEAARYEVEATSDKGCPSGRSNPREATIYPRPKVNIVVDGSTRLETCGEPVTLQAEMDPPEHGASYEWYENGVEQASAKTSPLYVVRSNADRTVGKMATVHLFVTDRHGCRSASRSNEVPVNIRELPANPEATVDSARGVCENESATMRVSPSGAGTYRWFRVSGRSYDTLGISSDTVYVASRVQVGDAGQYAVEVTNSYGCTSARKGVTNLNVLNLPVVRIREERACESWTSEHTVDFGEPKGGVFSGWGCDGGKFSPADVHSGKAVVTYTYRGPNGCENSDTKTIELIPLPNRPFVTAGGATSVCEDSISVELTASVATLEEDAGRYSYSYQWRKDGFDLPGEDGVSYVAQKAGAYTVRARNQGLCWADSASEVVRVSVLDLPETPVIATLNPFKCPGGSTALFVASMERGIFQWYKGDSRRMERILNEIDSVYGATEVGQYAVDLMGENGCRSALSDPITVGEYAPPAQPQIAASQDALYAGLDYKLLVRNPQAGYEYEWYKSDLSAGVSGVELPVVNLDGGDTGRYTVRVSDEHGCHAWSEDYLLAWDDAPLLIPNVFTPNGDGINDYFQILGLEDFAENRLDILNKQGRLIFTQKNYHNRWNGEGRPNDVFFYRLTLKRQDGSSFIRRGFVHLKN
jgi:gliding motility-associated-like protein